MTLNLGAFQKAARGKKKKKKAPYLAFAQVLENDVKWLALVHIHVFP